MLGYPVCIASPAYARNELLFNLCLVLAEDDDMSRYAGVVRKLARLFRSLEEHGQFLSRDLAAHEAEAAGGRVGGRWAGTAAGAGEVGADAGAAGAGTASAGGGGAGAGYMSGVGVGGAGGAAASLPLTRGKVYALCEIILEDLNNYCECMIPIGTFSKVWGKHGGWGKKDVTLDTQLSILLPHFFSHPIQFCVLDFLFFLLVFVYGFFSSSKKNPKHYSLFSFLFLVLCPSSV